VDAALTLAEASQVLDPPMTEQQLRAIIGALGWQPAGTRPSGRRGRPAATYPWQQISQLHAALVPWLAITYDKGDPTGLPEREFRHA
jgi:hypothetical protein